MRNYRKTSGSISADFVWVADNTVVTAHLKKFGNELVVTLWTTQSFPSGFVHLIIAQELLLKAQTERAAGLELDSIVERFLSTSLGNRSEPTDGFQMSFLPGRNEREGIALEHLELHERHSNQSVKDSSVIFQTARDYTLLVEFGISKPSAVIARTQLLQSKSIQQRIYLAREQGILQSHGKGRTTSIDERTAK